jgi:dihydropteroate synthase
MAHLRDRIEQREGTLVMGVLNCTPDSFSDGGLCADEQLALEHARRLLREGADIIDVGAESTRPGAPRIPAAEQIRRIGTVIAQLVSEGAAVSIDTTLSEVAEYALSCGASLVNSVELEPSAELARVAHAHHAMLALMHSRGAMTHMSGFSSMPADAYADVIGDVAREWATARDAAVAAGLPPSDVLLDPGLGFHKSADHSLELVCRLDELSQLGATVLVGPSRKSFLAKATSEPGREVAAPDARLGATIAACVACARAGAAILRVHDVFEVRQALRFDEALRRRETSLLEARRLDRSVGHA